MKSRHEGLEELLEGQIFVEGGVCAAKGFKAHGLNCGINPNKEKNDLGLIYSEVECDAAGVYTQNKVKGAPVIVTKDNLKKSGNKAQAVIVNSKNANTCNPNGVEIALKECELVGKALSIKPEQVIVASTGVIGAAISIDPFVNAMDELVKGLSYDGNRRALTAMMTTDTVEKEFAVEVTIDGKKVRVGGMAKGSGMINPNMATTLDFITTDAAISGEMLQKALNDTVKVTYNCLSVDGDTSTNDTLTVMANGLAGNEKITSEGADYEIFKDALYTVLLNLTKKMAADGEGASKFLECRVLNAPTKELATKISASVINSPLVKTAMFGCDANCGRIMCAIGYTEGDFSIEEIDLDLISEAGSLRTYEKGKVLLFSEEKAAEILKENKILIKINLNQGSESARAFGCDLTYDYVKINGDYRS